MSASEPTVTKPASDDHDRKTVFFLPSRDGIDPEILREEAATIATRRREAYKNLGCDFDEATSSFDDDQDLTEPAVGLALSSGGLRSSTFTLGFVQALHHLGLLRRCDYIASVSGGGFVSGYLAALSYKLGAQPQSPAESAVTERSEKTPTTASLHDRVATQTERGASEDRSLLGVNPDGRIMPNYPFSAIGEYLVGSTGDFVRFLFRYLAATLPLLLASLAPIGVCMTLAALFWRSLDDTAVREVLTLFGTDTFADQLNMDWEKLLAYLPAYFLTAAMVAIAAVAGIVQCYRGKPLTLRTIGGVGSVLLVLTLLSFVMGAITYQTNGYTSMKTPDAGRYLPDNARTVVWYFTLLMALPILFSRSLIDSAKATSPTWKKIFARTVFAVLVTCTPLLMFFWMVRENISDYVEHREPVLLRDDILDWNQIDNLALQLAVTNTATPLPQLTPSVYASFDPEITPVSNPAKRFRLLRGETVALADTGFWHRLAWLVPESMLWDESLQKSHQTARDYLQVMDTERIAQRDYLARDWNRKLASVDLSTNLLRELIIRLSVKDQTRNENPEKVTEQLLNMVDSLVSPGAPNRQLKLTDQQINEFVTNAVEFRRYPLALEEGGRLRTSLLAVRGVSVSEKTENSEKDKGKVKEKKDEVSRQEVDTAIAARLAEVFPYKFQREQFNRLLLETMYPDVFRKRMMVSTPVVIAHDQQTRWYWLSVWMTLCLIGWFFNANSQSPLYEYYRRRLASTFLQSAADENDPPNGVWPGRITPPLQQVKPWRTGGPFPIFVACMSLFQRLDWNRTRSDYFKVARSPKPNACNPVASMADDLPSFTMTPLHVGSYMLGYRKTSEYCDGELSLEDAVALSGAPLTPMVIKSLPLRIALSIFNARLGMWLPLPARSTALAASMPSVNLPNVVSAMLDTEREDMPRIGDAMVSDVLRDDVEGAPVPPVPGLRPRSERERNLWFYGLILLWLMVPLYLQAKGPMGWLFPRVVTGEFIDVPQPQSLPLLTSLQWAPLAILLGLLLLVNAVWLLSKARQWVLLRERQAFSIREWLAYGASGARADYRPVIDGCFHDPFGLEELLLRRCGLIILADGGRNNGEWQLSALASCLRMARERHGINLVDDRLDTSALEPSGELLPGDRRLQQSHFIHFQVRYPERPAANVEGQIQQPKTATIVYCQMSLTGDEDLDVLNFARRNTTFPNEPNANQFFSADQAETFRLLGYHIGEAVCDEMRPGPDRNHEPEKPPFSIKTWIQAIETAFDRAVSGGKASPPATDHKPTSSRPILTGG